jgi:threonylcarbamoyladenosine tRNA methylthiotransferase MtaB
LSARSISFETLGCKLNQYDTQLLIESFARTPGYRVVEPGGHSDISVINTCTVTSKTDRQSRNLIRRAVRKRPKPVVVVTGCYAEVDPGSILDISGVDHVVPNSTRWQDFERLFGVETAKTIHGFRNHTRAFIKVQEGCSNSCSYCIVTRARGEERARPSRGIAAEVEALVSQGFKEVVLTGTDLGKYVDESGEDLVALLRMLEDIDGLERIRLSSIHPDRVTKPLLDCFSSSSRLCPHLHLSIQSADDSVLNLMNRSYTRSDCERAVQNLICACPHIALGADFIAGFPGEDDPAFERTLDFVKGAGLAYLHVFPFSARSGTKAASMRRQVAPDIKRERAALLRQAGEWKWLAYRNRFLGARLECLVESRRRAGSLVGLSANYIRVEFEGDDCLRNRLVPVRFMSIDRERNYGMAESVRGCRA